MDEHRRQLERDLDRESGRTQLVASLDGASRIREGEEAEIWVDGTRSTSSIPDSGDNLTVDYDHAGRIPGHQK